MRDGAYIRFAPGAFSKALKRSTSDVVALWNHNTDMPLGRQSAGTLSLSEEEDGLHFSIDLPDVSYANDLRTLVERGDVNGCSFSVAPGKPTITKASDGTPIKTFTEVEELIDVSPVSLPAFTGTSLNRFAKSYENESRKSQITRAKHRVLTETNENYRRDSKSDGRG